MLYSLSQAVGLSLAVQPYRIKCVVKELEFQGKHQLQIPSVRSQTRF